MERRVVIGVAGLGCAVALAGCTRAAPAPLPPSSPVASSSTCGTDIPVGSGLIDATVISAPRGSAVGRSVSAVALTSPACGPPSTGVVQLTSCDPDEFPWTTSPASSNQELFRQGVRVMRQAFLEVDGRPVLREVVLDASPSGTMTQTYRNQLHTLCRHRAGARQRVDPTGRLDRSPSPGGRVQRRPTDGRPAGACGAECRRAKPPHANGPRGPSVEVEAKGARALVRDDRPQLSHGSPVARALPRHHALVIADGTQWV